MRIRNIDKNNDWKFGYNKSDYVRGAFAVALDIKMKLNEWLNDCFFQLDVGIPWDVRLGAKNQKKLLDRDIIERAESVEGVLSVFDFSSSLDGRHYKCSFKVYQEYTDDIIPISFDNIQG